MMKNRIKDNIIILLRICNGMDLEKIYDSK